MTDAHLTLEAVFDAYFDCRRTKRNSINQLRFEADLESNLVVIGGEPGDGMVCAPCGTAASCCWSSRTII